MRGLGLPGLPWDFESVFRCFRRVVSIFRCSVEVPQTPRKPNVNRIKHKHLSVSVDQARPPQETEALSRRLSSEAQTVPHPPPPTPNARNPQPKPQTPWINRKGPTRYDHRKNLMDYDYQTFIKEGHRPRMFFRGVGALHGLRGSGTRGLQSDLKGFSAWDSGGMRPLAVTTLKLEASNLSSPARQPNTISNSRTTIIIILKIRILMNSCHV